MKTFLRQTNTEIAIALLILLSLPVVSHLTSLQSGSGESFSWASVTDTLLQAWRIYVAAVISWGLMRILFPTVADWAAHGGFRDAFAALTDPGDSIQASIRREAAWRRLKLTGLAMAFCFFAPLLAILLF